MIFEKLFHNSDVLLTEGALVERLRDEFDVEFDKHINHAGVLYTNPDALECLYKQYVDIGDKYKLPIMLMTPTRKVNFESVKESCFSDKDIIGDSCAFLNKIKNQYPDGAESIMIGGLLGCKGDAYGSEIVLGIDEAYRFHRRQTLQFAKEEVDYLFAGIMPEINEALGMARAMADSQIPYIISFMIKKNGCLLDGTPISEAIRLIDKETNVKPLCYMTNCVHSTNVRQALANEVNDKDILLKRFKGIQANSSVLSPEELNNCGILQQGDFVGMVDEMQLLYREFDFKIFGGCCGTNDKFIDQLSAMLIAGK
ncbi:homocysteine S-methyltransferase family protein [Labilibaculum euxinus]